MKSSTSTRQSPAKKHRKQAGHFHVYFRGNNKYTVFYDEGDYIGFLQKLSMVAKLYNTRICAFVLMDNHVHLHIVTEDLTALMRTFLIRFSRWYNKRKGLTGKLFSTPFSSSHTYSRILIEDNLLYILSNPIKSYICEHPGDYKWSSYHSYFSDKKNPLKEFIDIDTSVLEEIFDSKKALDEAITKYNADTTKNRESHWDFTPDYEIIEHMNRILNGRNLFALTKDEMNALMISLRNDKSATFRQIATLTHGSYDETRKFFCHSK